VWGLKSFLFDFQGLIEYVSGSDEVKELGALDDKQKKQLESIRDLILFRFGSTGVVNAVNAAVRNACVVPVYIVSSIHNFGARAGEGCFKVTNKCVFCLLLLL
jgi:ribosome-binding ATPase YchF (GTP1/OBG family)